MNKQQQSLLIVVICVLLLIVIGSIIAIQNLLIGDLKQNIKTMKSENAKLVEDINEINRAYQAEIDRLTGKPLGDFVSTFYCPTGNKTSTGTVPKEGRTIAVDPDVIAPGSTVRIEHNGRSKIYKVEDSGVHGRVVDTFINSEEQATKLGVKKIKVYLVEE